MQIDGTRLQHDLDTLNGFGAGAGPGINRIAYSPADMEAREWVDTQLRAVGMETRRDAAGNTVAHYRGMRPELPAIALGSHTDTVPNGGRFDGALGVVAALACVRALHAAGVQLLHPVEVINFAAEEATMASGTLGSRAMCGLLDPAALAHPAWDGRIVREHMQAAGLDGDPTRQAVRRPGSLAAYLELHVEQGGTLEKKGKVIGVVEGIVSIRRYSAVFEGYADHAGTTPMDQRRDALVMAAPLVERVRDVAVAQGIVGTIGKVVVLPGAPNVIPGRVELNMEIRGLDEAVLDQADEEIAHHVRALGGALELISRKPPIASDSRLVKALCAACEELGLPYMRLPSGAGHDAMCVASIAPQAMLFVPSRGGVSHSPDEFTAPEHCLAGARVLLAALLRLDREW